MAAEPSNRLVNLLGALALGVSDRIRAAAAESMPLGGETIAALIVIGHAPAMSIDQLSQILRLTHAGTVRLVDRLVERNLIEKRPSTVDRRSVTLFPTSTGRKRRGRVLALRRAALLEVLDRVSPDDLGALERIAETITGGLADDPLSALTTCRFCDEQVCDACPMDAFGSL
jgi:MarR family transcriptional regulator, negative regulator of the multidrug operon emrRAB